jgi:hypothetical protein
VKDLKTLRDDMKRLDEMLTKEREAHKETRETLNEIEKQRKTAEEAAKKQIIGLMGMESSIQLHFPVFGLWVVDFDSGLY